MSNDRLASMRRPPGVIFPLFVLAVCWLVLAPTARAELLKPAVKLGPTIVLNGIATVNGTVNGLGPAGATLTINGQPVGVNANGTFASTLNLAGQSALAIEVANPATGEKSTVSIPLTTNVIGPGGLIPPEVLSAIERAAVSILEPIGGFKILDGKPISVEGSVGNKDELVSLKVNGVDALGAVNNLGSFSVPIPGTDKTVTVTTTDSRGVTTTTTYPVAQGTTTPAAAAAPTVAAAKAVGLKVASVRYVTRSFRKTKRVQMIVTIKDSLGRLVRGATVQVRAAPAKGLRVKPRIKRTGKNGRVSFLLHPRARVFGKKLTTVTVAKTPTAKAQRKTSVRVPKLRARSTTRKKR